LGLVFAIKTEVLRAAPAGQYGKRVDGGFRAAELVDERGEGRRTDVFAPDEREPRKPRAAIEPHGRPLAPGLSGCFRQSASPRPLPAAGYWRRGGCKEERSATE